MSLDPRKVPQAARGDRGVDDGSEHRTGLIDQHDDLPLLEMAPTARGEQRPFDHDAAVLGVVVTQVAPDGGTHIQIA
ncbi:Uncharacterised protein [Mycobacteroides abscessus subsp. abscessus]|nr:Uncharacterised protein [Mycobacteroides abscessus subsp. abscessus]